MSNAATFQSGAKRLDVKPRSRVIERASLLQMDLLLFLAAVGIIGFSVFTMIFTTQDDVAGDPYFYIIRQSIYAVLGIAAMLAVSRIDYSRFRELRVGLYSGMIVAITTVLILGSATRGSKRWIEFPFFTLQPSELGKVLLIAALSGFAIERARRSTERQRTARLLLLGLAPAAIVLVQPDLGTALVYGVITVAVLFIAGIHWSHFAFLGGVLVAAVLAVLVVAPALNQPLLQDYQQARLTAFLNPSDDPRDGSYQTQQSLIAVGSGGKTGRGDNSTQQQSGFLPEGRTDFIFAVVAERWGFVGAAFLLSLYALLVWRGLRILTLSKNLYGSMIAAGVVAMLMFQIFVNVGMNIGLMPVTGLPLPLMSYGGSSVIVTFMAIGLLQSVYIQAQLSSKTRAQPLF